MLCTTVSVSGNAHQTVSGCGRPPPERCRFSPGSFSRHTWSFCDEDKRMCVSSEWESGSAEVVVAIFVLHSVENVTANLFCHCEVASGWTTTTAHHKLVIVWEPVLSMRLMWSQSLSGSTSSLRNIALINTVERQQIIICIGGKKRGQMAERNQHLCCTVGVHAGIARKDQIPPHQPNCFKRRNNTACFQAAFP